MTQPTAATDGSGVATVALSSDVVDSTDGALKLITYTLASEVVVRTTARTTAS